MDKDHYFWIRLRRDFMNGDAVEYLMSQKNGSDYVVLYQMLILSAMNSGGKLQSIIGDMVIPYDEKRMQRECRYFDLRTIKKGLELYQKLGLIFLDNNGVMEIENFKNIVGKETPYAEQKREQRQKSKSKNVDNVQDNVQDNVHIELELEKEKKFKNNNDIVVVVSENDDYDDDDTEKAIKYAKENLGMLSRKQEEKLRQICRQQTPGIVIYAIDQACAYGKNNYAYVFKTLEDYWHKGFDTADQVQAWDKKRSALKAANPNINVASFAPRIR